MLKWLKEKALWLLAVLGAVLVGFVAAVRRTPTRPIAREVDRELGRSEEVTRRADKIIKDEREKLEDRKEQHEELKRKLRQMDGQRKGGKN